MNTLLTGFLRNVSLNWTSFTWSRCFERLEVYCGSYFLTSLNTIVDWSIYYLNLILMSLCLQVAKYFLKLWALLYKTYFLILWLISFIFFEFSFITLIIFALIWVSLFVWTSFMIWEVLKWLEWIRLTIKLIVSKVKKINAYPFHFGRCQ